MCVCVCVCVRARVRACLRACGWVRWEHVMQWKPDTCEVTGGHYSLPKPCWQVKGWWLPPGMLAGPAQPQPGTCRQASAASSAQSHAARGTPAWARVSGGWVPEEAGSGLSPVSKGMDAPRANAIALATLACGGGAGQGSQATGGPQRRGQRVAAAVLAHWPICRLCAL